MSKQFKGTINIDVRDSVSDWEPYEQPKAPAGAPNVLFIVWGKPVLGRCRPSVAPSRRRQWIGWQMAACATRSSTPQRCAPPHECVTADRSQPHHCWHGLHLRSRHRLPRFEWAHSLRDGDNRRGAQRRGLQHLHARQVALLP
jgi:hypothetical protein